MTQGAFQTQLIDQSFGLIECVRRDLGIQKQSAETFLHFGFSQQDIALLNQTPEIASTLVLAFYAARSSTQHHLPVDVWLSHATIQAKGSNHRNGRLPTAPDARYPAALAQCHLLWVPS